MSDIRGRRFRRHTSGFYKVAQKNFYLILSTAALAFGGMTLLFYALSIEQLPEFSWNDLTGTILAVCATGALTVTVVVIYCLSAGFFARFALELVYPEARDYSPGSKAQDVQSETLYTSLFSPSFIFGSTAFSFLFWIGVQLSLGSDKLIAPYHTYFVAEVGVAFVSIALLALLGRRAWQWAHHLLYSAAIGSSVAAFTTLFAWLYAPSSYSTKSVEAQREPVQFDWVTASIWLLDHAWIIGLMLSGAMMLSLSVKRFIPWLNKAVPRLAHRSPPWMSKFLTTTVGWSRKTVLALLGGPSDRRLLGAKFCVTFVFCSFAIVVLVMAGGISSVGNANDRGFNFVFIVVLLILLNWVSFYVGEWKERIALGLITAALVFFICPLITHMPTMFPRMVVTMLGLGNKHLDTVGISAKQCATLAPYGVTCPSEDGEAITLTNVNMLNRLGGVIALELLVEEDGSSTSDLDSTNEDGPQPRGGLSVVADMERGELRAKKCDSIFLSQLTSEDPIKPSNLRCVAFMVPKDQVVGYTTTRSRTYRSFYSGYKVGPEKDPTVVRFR